MKTKLIASFVVALGVVTAASCVPLAVGATAGYVAHKEGYRVRNPIVRTGH